MTAYQPLLALIHQWGVDRNIIGDGTSQAQFLKLSEEFSEYAEATNEKEKRDGIGDCVVVLGMIAGIEDFDLRPLNNPESFPVSFNWVGTHVLFGHLAKAISRKSKNDIILYTSAMFSYLLFLAGDNETYFTQCIQESYDEIKDRKGVLLDGIYIKEEDERYASALETIEQRKQAN